MEECLVARLRLGKAVLTAQPVELAHRMCQLRPPCLDACFLSTRAALHAYRTENVFVEVMATAELEVLTNHEGNK